MCGLCGILGTEHWADQAGPAGTNGATSLRRTRLRRARLLNDVLSLYRLKIDDWHGTFTAVRGPTGRTELAETLPELWRKAEAVANRALDPLDPLLLDHLEGIVRERGS
jgi:hypothetical protein